jgi:hypothetical protein
MAYELEDIELLELSLVDNPANQHAAVVLFKNLGYETPVKPESAGTTERGEGPVTVEELTKSLADQKTQAAELTKAAAEATAKAAAAEAALAAMTKSATDAGLDVKDGLIVKRADPEFVMVGGEKVEKSLVPAPVLKALEQAAADIAKMQAQAEEVTLAKRGTDELPNLAGTPLAKGRLLALAEKDADVLKALKAADAAMASTFVEKGHSRVEDEASPEYRLDQMAKAYQTANNVPYETAYAAVVKTNDGRALYKSLRDTAN